MTDNPLAPQNAAPDQIRTYASVHFGDSHALVPVRSKLYLRILRALMLNAIENPTEGQEIQYAFQLRDLADSEVLTVLATSYERPILPSTGPAFAVFGKNARIYAAMAKKRRLDAIERALNKPIDNSVQS